MATGETGQTKTKTRPDAQGAPKGDSAAAGTQTGDAGDGAETQPDGNDDDASGADADAPPTGKTYTQAEVDAMVNARIARAKKQAAKEAEETLKRERERANMDEAERVKAEMADREKELNELRAQNKRLSIANQLAGKVVNVDDAVRLVDEDLIDDDGRLDVDRFLESRPYLRADAQRQAGGTANPGSPPAGKRLTRDQIASMSEQEIEKRWDEVKAVLDS